MIDFHEADITKIYVLSLDKACGMCGARGTFSLYWTPISPSEVKHRCNNCTSGLVKLTDKDIFLLRIHGKL